jgi:hypothetical protein
MQNKHFVFIVIVIIFAISSSPALALTMAEIMPRGYQPQVLSASAGGMQGHIFQAKQMLAGVTLNYTISPTYAAGKISGYTVPTKDLAVVVLDPATNKIYTTKAIQRGTTFEFTDKKFNIETRVFNGVNTHFKVHTPTNGVVIALKYLITKDGISEPDVKSKMHEAIYVPYSNALQSPELVEAGKQYLNSVIAQASQEVSHAPSHSQPGKKLSEAISAEQIKAIIYAEHVSMWEYDNISKTDLMNKINTLFGANGPDTYKYSVSSAGAGGTAQFMPATYASLVQRRTELHLMPDFVEGMRNHVNAVKAMYGLLDDYGSTVKTLTKAAYVPNYAFDYAAAAYNGGPVKVARAANNYGHSWNALQPDTYKSLRPETVGYVTKIRGFLEALNQEKPRTI